jgi:hypothetical protein
VREEGAVAILTVSPHELRARGDDRHARSPGGRYEQLDVDVT